VVNGQQSLIANREKNTFLIFYLPPYPNVTIALNRVGGAMMLSLYSLPLFYYCPNVCLFDLFDSRLVYKLYVHAPNRSFVRSCPFPTTRDSPNGARSVNGVFFWGGGP
jgi:hypothetical protein